MYYVKYKITKHRLDEDVWPPEDEDGRAQYAWVPVKHDLMESPYHVENPDGSVIDSRYVQILWGLRWIV